MGRPIVRRSQAEWKEIVREQKLSGLDGKAYCRRESIGLASFYKWQRRLSTESIRVDRAAPKKHSFINVGNIEPIRSPAVTKKGLEIDLDLGNWLRFAVRRG